MLNWTADQRHLSEDEEKYLVFTDSKVFVINIKKWIQRSENNFWGKFFSSMTVAFKSVIVAFRKCKSPSSNSAMHKDISWPKTKLSGLKMMYANRKDKVSTSKPNKTWKTDSTSKIFLD